MTRGRGTANGYNLFFFNLYFMEVIKKTDATVTDKLTSDTANPTRGCSGTE